MIFYLSLIPSRLSVREGEPLNVLLLARSRGEDTVHPFQFWVRGESDPDGEWKPALTESKAMRADHNEHLYFQIPAAAFAGEQEVILSAGDQPPEKMGKMCCLIVVQPAENTREGESADD